MAEKDSTSVGKPQKGQSRSIVCLETGEMFSSAEEAAAAVGIKDKSNIYFAIRKRRTAGGYHWYWEDEPRPDVEQLKDRRRRAVVCWETGEEYESAAAAGKAVGVTNLTAALRTGGMAGGYHWYYKGDPKPDASTYKGNKPVVCWETGEVFRSAQEAADWAGTTVSGIYTSVRTKNSSGGYHWYLEGDPKSGEPPQATGGRKSRAVVCVETGETYESAKAAAEAMGIAAPHRIHAAAKSGGKAGGFHWVYAGVAEASASGVVDAQSGEEVPTREELQEEPAVASSAAPVIEQGRRSKPVVCAETGEMFASAKEAAAAVGIKDPKNVLNAANTGCTSGGFHWFFQGENGPRERQRKQRAVACWETGEVFPSEEEAAAWAGTTVEAIDTVMRTHRTAGGYHWYLEGKPKPAVDELVERRGVVCWETDEVYESAEAAAEAAGVSMSTIWSALRAKSHAAGGYHWYWEGEPKPDASQFKPKKNHAIRCVETGVVYESITAAAKAVGLKAGSPIGRAARTGRTAARLHWEYVD